MVRVSKFDDPEAEWAAEAPGRYCLAACYCGRCPQYVPLPPVSAAPSRAPRRLGTPRPRPRRRARARRAAAEWDPEFSPAEEPR
jgi:hypothetical protein